MPRGVKTARSVNKTPKRTLETKDCDGTQAYGIVTKLLGNGRMQVKLEDAGEATCKVRGSMRKREWVNLNDWVLVAFRDFGDSHDIIRRYSPEEVHQLKYLGEIVEPTEREDDDNLVTFEDI